MTQVCKCCSHPKRLDIDRAIVRGQTLAGLSRQYGVSECSLTNHRDNHISRQLLKAEETRMVLHSKELLDTITGLLDKSQDILQRAESKDDLPVALRAIAESRATIELMCRLAAHVQQIRSQEEEQEQQAAIDVGLGRLTTKELAVLSDLTKKMQGHDVDVVKKHLTTELVIVDESPQTVTHRETQPSPQPLCSPICHVHFESIWL